MFYSRLREQRDCTPESDNSCNAEIKNQPELTAHESSKAYHHERRQIEVAAIAVATAVPVCPIVVHAIVIHPELLRERHIAMYAPFLHAHLAVRAWHWRRIEY